MTPQSEALRLLDDALHNLESPKGSVEGSVQKLLRASTLLGEEDIRIWCQIQLGEPRYTGPLKKLVDVLWSELNEKAKKKAISEVMGEIKPLQLNHASHFPMEELKVKYPKSGGGYVSIGFVEERYADLVRVKNGNDGTYYKNNLFTHLNYVRKKAHELASRQHAKLKFAGTVGTCFDVLKDAVDDKLLELDSAFGEQLMLAFKAISTDKPEQWSHALTSVRRLLEALADRLLPAESMNVKGRPLGQHQYVNRLWAFMDRAIESETNRELAKSHVDFLGAWLERTNKVANKGVHGEVTQLEAVKAVFHAYLILADILDHLKARKLVRAKLDINKANLDELEIHLQVSRATAKEIVKARVKHGHLDKAMLAEVRGVGPKTLERAEAAFAFEEAAK
jgi:hypothetical protein